MLLCGMLSRRQQDCQCSTVIIAFSVLTSNKPQQLAYLHAAACNRASHAASCVLHQLLASSLYMHNLISVHRQIFLKVRGELLSHSHGELKTELEEDCCMWKYASVLT